MKTAGFLSIVLLAGTIFILGCKSDGDGDSGGVDVAETCDFELCVENDILRATCEDELEDCLATGKFDEDECVAFANETCNVPE